MSLISLNFEFPTHVCWIFINLIAAFPKSETLQKIGMANLHRIYVSDASYLPVHKRNGELTMNLKRINRSSESGSLAMDLKYIIQSSMWNTVSLVLLGQANG